MNKYIVAFLFLLSASALADVPSHLKGAKITVTLADGTTSTVSADQFKVVPRIQQPVVAKTHFVINQPCTTTITTVAPNRNRLSIIAGYGRQNGLNTTVSGTTLETENKVGFVGGGQYQRLLTDTFSLGIQYQTNQTTSILGGFEF